MAASGTCGYGEELHPFVDLNCLGAVVVKGLSLRPSRESWPTAGRDLAVACSILSGSKILALRRSSAKNCPVCALSDAHCGEFFWRTPEEYAAVAARASEAEGIAALEANISCPNVQHGGMLFSSDPRLTFEVVVRVRKATPLPLIVKLSPNVTDITVIARAAEEAGADAVSLINTLMGMAIDLDHPSPRLPLGFGGLSGPAIKPVALRMVWQVAQGVHIPVIGIGGIATGEDALEFIMAGATACQVGTASFVDPRHVERFCRNATLLTASSHCHSRRTLWHTRNFPVS